jgi:uncharacterized protein
MRTASPFHVHVADLLHNAGEVRTHRVVAPVDWGIEMSRVVAEPPLEADLDIVSMPGGLLVRGIVTVTAVNTCARCLTESEEHLRVEIAQLVETGNDDDHDEYHVAGEDLDLEPILRDEALLALPLLPRCDPECEGLVGDSESDLNTASPGSAGPAESPFAALQDLFDTGD